MADNDVDFYLTVDLSPAGVRYLLGYHRGAARVEVDVGATAARDIVTTAPAQLPAKVKSAMGSALFQIPANDRDTWASLSVSAVSAGLALYAP